MNNKVLEALKEINRKLDEDPVYLQEFINNVNHQVTLDENEFDAGVWVPTLGHMLAEACGSATVDKCYEELYFGSYSRHGQGD